MFGPTVTKWGLLLRFLLASLLFHRKWMLENIGPDFIHHSGFFNRSLVSEELYDRLAAKTKICYPWTQDSEVSRDNHFPIMGLPQAVIDFNYHQQQLSVLTKLPEIIVESIVAKLDERGIGGGELSLTKLREELRSLLKEELKELNVLEVIYKCVYIYSLWVYFVYYLVYSGFSGTPSPRWVLPGHSSYCKH